MKKNQYTDKMRYAVKSRFVQVFVLVIGLIVLTGTANAQDILEKQATVKQQNSKSDTSVKTAQPVSNILLKGFVRNSDGQPLSGASVLVSGTSKGVPTRPNGSFQLQVPSTTKAFMVMHIGHITEIVDIIPGKEYDIKLKVGDKDLDEVVVTGVFTRKKESFTGATAAFTGDQLKSIGGQNVFQSLKTLDPSFIIVENNSLGSDPNANPTIEVRGKTAATFGKSIGEFETDPNQPLLILDGFEASMSIIKDLDMNMVASATILKDAASTAIYGSKAANGVLVIETKAPMPGKLRFNYTNDYRVEMPDLSSYNMMNSAEKLQFEDLYGLFGNRGGAPTFIQAQKDRTYNALLAEVKRGVNTYWMNEPVQTGLTVGHSATVSGGNNELLYSVGGNYKKQKGVMKGSGRNTWGGRINLNYRKNSVNVTNNFYISGYNSSNSPYGNFSTYVEMNPYYRKRDEEGKIGKKISFEDLYSIDNPLFNATLNSYSRSNGYTINNNSRIIWTLNPSIKFEGGFSINKNLSISETFTDPRNSSFDQLLPMEKGRYNNNQSQGFGYQGNLGLTYGRLIQKKHQITANLRTEIQSNTNSSFGAGAEGFPVGSNGSPSVAYNYPSSGRPLANNATSRRSSFAGSANYAYEGRYLLDATVKYDGSSLFGSNQKYSSFWALGAGWNVHKEQFLNHAKWITQWKLRGNVGTNGNQNSGMTTSTSTYNTLPGGNEFGQGIIVSTLGNPNLKWTKTLQTSIGTDITLFKNLLNFTVNAYRKYSNPLAIGFNQAPSTGVLNKDVNVGNMVSTGVEGSIRLALISNTEKGIYWSVNASGASVKSKFGNLNTALESLNTAIDKERTNGISNRLDRYKDGYSPDDIWAVQSLGIDPATGTEVFLSKDGSSTLVWDSRDIVKIGNSRPAIEGVIGTSLRYKEFNFSINMRYSKGADVFNDALYQKVENITGDNAIKNQDKRALYNRWKKPGDIAQFKSLYEKSSTQKSSRFLQENNYLSGESISFGWQLSNYQWIKRLKIQSLNLNAYMNEIFRISNVKAERGTYYPFARTVSFSATVNF